MRVCAVLMVVLLAVSSGWSAEYLKDPAKAGSWVLEVNGNGSARALMHPEGTGIRIDVAAVGADAWNVQVVQYDKALQRGKRYILRFAAKASTARTISTYGQIGVPPWEHFWTPQSLNVTTQYQTFTFEVIPDRDTNGKGSMVIAVGTATGSVWIKDASLRDASDAAPRGFAAASTAAPAPAFAPAPAPAPATAPAAVPAPGAGGNVALTDYMVSPNDPASWVLETHENATATMRAEEGGLRVDVTTSSEQRWHVQLQQAGKTLSPGKAYVMTFQAKASAPHKIAVITAQQDGDPWHVMGGQADIDLGTSWKQYKLQFRINADASGTMRSPVVQPGDAVGTTWLRNVTLTDAPAAK